MLRVGLTGGLGSGKSTVAGMFARQGVYVLEADQIGRELMQPGQPVYAAILSHFRQYPDAPQLNAATTVRWIAAALARYVFSTNRLEELSRIVHPAVIAEQECRMDAIFVQDPARDCDGGVRTHFRGRSRRHCARVCSCQLMC